MESTGVYWKPVWNLLEEQFALLLVNARHVKAVPGRKTDIKDAEWLADLLRHGLLRGSFVPDRPRRELRELTRYRMSLVQERSAEVNRLQKTLEGANIKLGDVATDIMGVSATADAAGPDRRCHGGGGRGRVGPGQAAGQATRVRAALHRADRSASTLSPGSAARPHRAVGGERSLRSVPRSKRGWARLRANWHQLQTIPGVGLRTAQVLVAEVGTDMRRFPSAEHLASWAGMCPGNDESAGKRRSGKNPQR